MSFNFSFGCDLRVLTWLPRTLALPLRAALFSNVIVMLALLFSRSGRKRGSGTNVTVLDMALKQHLGPQKATWTRTSTVREMRKWASTGPGVSRRSSSSLGYYRDYQPAQPSVSGICKNHISNIINPRETWVSRCPQWKMYRASRSW